MTRDEAIKIVMARYDQLSFGGKLEARREIAESDIDIWTSLGMLKLDEPKSAMTVFCEEIGWSEGGVSYQEFFRCLNKAGLKIVEK